MSEQRSVRDIQKGDQVQDPLTGEWLTVKNKDRGYRGSTRLIFTDDTEVHLTARTRLATRKGA